ncbi:MAG: hypothetical protein AAF658_11225, partial [Myxococcota bacterium]
GNALGQPSIETNIADWRRRNGCSEPGTDREFDGVRRRSWSCSAGTVVELITIEDHGHPWAGSPPETSTVGQGPMTDKFSSTDELLRFVKDRLRSP